MEQQRVIWSVSDVNSAVRELVEGSLMPFWLAGEVGSLTLHRSGHAYFSLKDSKTQIRAVFFGGGPQCVRQQVANGGKIEVFGNLTVYEARGEYQFNVKQLRPAGLGDLQRKFEELKQKLAAEGLFAPARKRPIPMLPARIGVVTSPTGAAVKDFLQIVNRRFPNVNIKVFPCMVQGAGAGVSVARGVEFFNRAGNVDVIVVTRGGGSMEDLWEFNDETLARTIAASRIPVISAVGHEIDFTICDFVADLRVPTPSAAAELVIGKREEFAVRLERAAKDMRHVLDFARQNMRGRLERAAGSFVFREPGHLLKMRAQQLDELEMRMGICLKHFHDRRKARIDQLESVLNTLNPARQLERGYAMLFERESGRLVSHSAIAPHTRLTAKLSDGSLNVTVDGTE